MFSRPIILDLEPTQTINDIKLKLKELENIELEQQRLVYLKEPLDEESKTIEDYNIKNNAVIYLMVRLFVKKESNESTRILKKPKKKYLL